jgi:hypothetical protein
MPPGFGALGEHRLAGLVACERQRGEPRSPNLGIVNKPHLSAPLSSPPGRLDCGSCQPGEQYYGRAQTGNVAIDRRAGVARIE